MLAEFSSHCNLTTEIANKRIDLIFVFLKYIKAKVVEINLNYLALLVVVNYNIAPNIV